MCVRIKAGGYGGGRGPANVSGGDSGRPARGSQAEFASGSGENFGNKAALGIPCPRCSDAGNETAPTSPAALRASLGGPGRSPPTRRRLRRFGSADLTAVTVRRPQPASRRRSPCADRRRSLGPACTRRSPAGPQRPGPHPGSDQQAGGRAGGLAGRERAPLPLGAPALAAPPLSCPGRARRGCIRAGGGRCTWSEARGLSCSAPAADAHALPTPRPSDLGRPRASQSSGAPSAPSRCPLCPPPAAVTPKSWHQTLATPCSAKPPRRPPGPGRDSRAPAAPPPGSPPAAGDLGGG